MQIAVRDHQHIIPGRWQHIDEIADFPVWAMQGRIDNDCDVTLRKSSLQPLRDRQRRIGPVVETEDDLKRRVILTTGGGQRLLQ